MAFQKARPVKIAGVAADSPTNPNMGLLTNIGSPQMNQIRAASSLVAPKLMAAPHAVRPPRTGIRKIRVRHPRFRYQAPVPAGGFTPPPVTQY